MPTCTHPDLAPVDPDALRAEIRVKYAEVATNPGGVFHFHTGRALAEKLGYPAWVHTLPDAAIPSFAGSTTPSSRVTLRREAGCSTSAPAAGSTALSPPSSSAPPATSSVPT